MTDQPQPQRAHYEIREHPIRGMVNIVWIDPAQRRTAEDVPGMSFGEHALPLLADAIGKYLLDKARAGQEAPAEDEPPPDALARRRQARRDGGFP